MIFEKEYKFTLPIGYLDTNGILQKNGVMRQAKAGDEVYPMRDPRVIQNPEYAMIITLGRVITRIGDNTQINCELIENLYVKDFVFLKDMYKMINKADDLEMEVVCPYCNRHHEVLIDFTKFHK
ncbi:MAG: phage tail assembly protein [Erysipelotrichaceae bacterium]